MELLTSAVESRDPSMIMLRAFPMYDSLRGHAAFPALLREVGLG